MTDRYPNIRTLGLGLSVGIAIVGGWTVSHVLYQREQISASAYEADHACVDGRMGFCYAIGYDMDAPDWPEQRNVLGLRFDLHTAARPARLHFTAITAGSRRAKTAKLVKCAASQSGPKASPRLHRLNTPLHNPPIALCSD